VVSVSWPTPVTTGTLALQIASATGSSLKHHRSSSEPPPRAITIRSTPEASMRRIAAAISFAAAAPCTAVWTKRSG
jgi:hypothetical protein